MDGPGVSLSVLLMLRLTAGTTWPIRQPRAQIERFANLGL
jgi:hypothetical protein